MKRISLVFVILVTIFAASLSVNAQSDESLLEIMAESLDLGIKQLMSSPDWEGLIAQADCKYDGKDIVITMKYDYTTQYLTQSELDIFKTSLTTENLKISQCQTLNSSFTSNLSSSEKQMFIDLLRNNNCNFIYDLFYIFPSETKHINLILTADDISGNTTSKKDFIDMFINTYRTALKSEVEKGNIADGSIEFDGTTIIITYIYNLDKEIIDNLPTKTLEDAFVKQMKSTPTSLAEMQQLKLNHIDLAIIYSGINGGYKNVFIDTAQF